MDEGEWQESKGRHRSRQKPRIEPPNAWFSQTPSHQIKLLKKETTLAKTGPNQDDKSVKSPWPTLGLGSGTLL